MKAGRALRKGASALLLGLLAACLAECADEPKPHCLVSPAPFAVKLIERSRTPDCDATFGPASFNEDPTAGLEAYFPRDSKGQPDYNHGSVAIKTGEVADLVDSYGVDNAATDGKVYSLGDFTGALSDDDNFCTVPTTSVTHLVLPAIAAVPDDPTTPDDDSVPAKPPVDITLKWSNIQIYVTAALNGTEFQADLEDTRPTAAGGTCTIVYKALGLSNAVQCSALDMDGNPIPGQTDPEACNPIPDPAAGRYTNNGISPLAKQSCDPIVAWCLIEGDSVPAIH